MIVYSYILLKIRNISDKFCRENKSSSFMFNQLFFPKLYLLQDNVKNMAEPCRSQMTVQCGACALQCEKITIDTRSEHIILTAFLL